MLCNECQSMIRDYLKDRLTPKELERFLVHIRSCPECYEELETYFIISFATRLLDEGAEVSYDLTGILKEDLEKKERMLRRRRMRRIRRIIMLSLLLVDIALTLQIWGSYTFL